MTKKKRKEVSRDKERTNVSWKEETIIKTSKTGTDYFQTVHIV